MSTVIDAVPQGYHLYAYDDCGMTGRQPHVLMDDSYIWTFNTSDTDAPLKERSAVFSYKQVNMAYGDLDPKLSYVLVMTYASDHVYKRVQSLWADGVELHGPMALPNAKAIRVICKVPEEVTRDGKMKLEIRIHGEVNATCSIVELWATAPPRTALHLSSISALNSDLVGRVLDLAYDPAPGVSVTLSRPGGSKPLASNKTNETGEFRFSRSAFEGIRPRGDLVIAATREGSSVTATVKPEDQFFEPVHYRPIPAQTAGLEKNTIRMDGGWRINTEAPADAHLSPLDSPEWHDITVPGQWLQQGFDVPQDRTVAMARMFDVPKEWQGYRVFLRFDAIHAGTHYRLNGKELGYSENLFTPVEWEITDAVSFGEPNRADLSMRVDTVSEKLSYSSGYAFHNLGGIDRFVRVYALPKARISQLHIDAGLDAAYRDGVLKVRAAVVGANLPLAPSQREGGLAVRVRITGAGGKPVEHSAPEVKVKNGRVEITSRVANPLKWSAEKPHLYGLTIELVQGGRILERVERAIGFRRVEIKGRQLFVNGVRVKLAGTCRHEIDPLTGRADTARHAEDDVKLLKAANLNYIRTSHYPPTQEFLDACDRLGMYVECEAPFCWVQPNDELADVKEVLTPTSAMVDYCHSHPSIIIWSIANESHYNPVFRASRDLVKSLDPTRPTTFNHPMSNEDDCDIANRHYPGMPYDEVLKDDPRPLILGEYMFPVCHEQTDVNIDPGLRELWGHGHAEPESEWAKLCAKTFQSSPCLLPGAAPGFWSHIHRSEQLIGGAIWAAFDEPYYFANGKHCGYAWVHGFWGLIDAWRRPKTEWYLARLIFSPVWFSTRHVAFMAGQESVRIPVENRYSFTNLGELRFEWQIGSKKGKLKADLAPGKAGEIEVPVPAGTREGDRVRIDVTDGSGAFVNVAEIVLGRQKPEPLPEPSAGAPKWQDDGQIITVEGEGFGFVIDKVRGDLDAASPKHKSALTRFPLPHLTRFDFGDLMGPNSPPYAVFPDAETRVVESVETREHPGAVEITIGDRYDLFSGSVTWLIDSSGTGKVTSDYTYSGDDMYTRETGIRFLLRPDCDEVRWRRWSEWGDVFPDDAVCRTSGSAKARRDPKLGSLPENLRPPWPWALDQTEMGTNDFRSVKFCIYDAALVNRDGSGLEVLANADAHVRPALTEDGVALHVLSECRLGPTVLKKGDHVHAEFTVRVLP